MNKNKGKAQIGQLNSVHLVFQEYNTYVGEYTQEGAHIETHGRGGGQEKFHYGGVNGEGLHTDQKGLLAETGYASRRHSQGGGDGKRSGNRHGGRRIPPTQNISQYPCIFPLCSIFPVTPPHLLRVF